MLFVQVYLLIWVFSYSRRKTGGVGDSGWNMGTEYAMLKCKNIPPQKKISTVD